MKRKTPRPYFKGMDTCRKKENSNLNQPYASSFDNHGIGINDYKVVNTINASSTPYAVALIKLSPSGFL